ncbi:MAG: hypothetical protein MZU97_23750 [Bacillus subtilis]|nr:hypothetical protein [Bacillus subtilis]
MADEPTGALDSKTSHANHGIDSRNRQKPLGHHGHPQRRTGRVSTATATVQLFDGLVIEDSLPMASANVESTGKLLNKKTSMSYSDGAQDKL